MNAAKMNWRKMRDNFLINKLQQKQSPMTSLFCCSGSRRYCRCRFDSAKSAREQSLQDWLCCSHLSPVGN